MPKQKPPESEPNEKRVVDELHKAVQAFVSVYGGDAWIVGPIHVEQQKQPTSFHVVIECAGRKPPLFTFGKN